MSVEIQYWHIFLIICCMSETKQNGGNKVEPHGDMKNDPLEEAIISARLMQELHKYGRRDRPLTLCLAWQEHRRKDCNNCDYY